MQLQREKEVRARLGPIARLTCNDLLLDSSHPLSFTFDLDHILRTALDKNREAYIRYFGLSSSLERPYRSVHSGFDLHDSTVVILADAVTPLFEHVSIIREQYSKSQNERKYHGFPDLFFSNFIFPYRLQHEVLEGIHSYLLEVKCSNLSGGRRQLNSYHREVLGKERPCIKLLLSVGQDILERVGEIAYAA